jgi:hypothetical protein
MTPDSELHRLRGVLYNSDWEIDEIEEIMDQASKDVNEMILDIVENAVAEAVDYAQELGAEKFIEDIDIIEGGGYFRISTVSGITDYSTPKRQMLPSLLKGQESRVIPVGGKKETIYGDIFSVMKDRQKQIDEARASLIENNLDRRSNRANQLAGQFKSILQRNLVAKRTERKVNISSSQDIEFRTASIKQDPDESWVYPAKELDMTGFLMDLNSRMITILDSAVSDLIDNYIKAYI